MSRSLAPLLLALCACSAAPPPAPALAPSRAFNRTPPAASPNLAPSRDAVQRVEQRYRASSPERGLRAASVVEQAVGRLAQNCRLLPRPLGASVLRFELRCSNQMFQPGVTRLEASAAAQWREAARLLGGLLSGADSFEAVRIHLVGRTDRIGLAPTTYRRADVLGGPRCVQAGSPCEAPAEVPVASLEDEPAQRAANQGLSWERAANLAQQLLCGFAGRPAADACDGPAPAPPAGVELTVVGAGTSLFDALAQRANSHRPAAGYGTSGTPFDFAAARVVDAVIDLVPRQRTESRPCAEESSLRDPDQARLYCLQDAASHSGVVAARPPDQAPARCPDPAGPLLVTRVGAASASPTCLTLLEEQLLQR